MTVSFSHKDPLFEFLQQLLNAYRYCLTKACSDDIVKSEYSATFISLARREFSHQHDHYCEKKFFNAMATSLLKKLVYAPYFSAPAIFSRAKQFNYTSCLPNCKEFIENEKQFSEFIFSSKQTDISIFRHSECVAKVGYIDDRLTFFYGDNLFPLTNLAQAESIIGKHENCVTVHGFSFAQPIIKLLQNIIF